MKKIKPIALASCLLIITGCTQLADSYREAVANARAKTNGSSREESASGNGPKNDKTSAEGSASAAGEIALGFSKEISQYTYYSVQFPDSEFETGSKIVNAEFVRGQVKKISDIFEYAENGYALVEGKNAVEDLDYLVRLQKKHNDYFSSHPVILAKKESRSRSRDVIPVDPMILNFKSDQNDTVDNVFVLGKREKQEYTSYFYYWGLSKAFGLLVDGNIVLALDSRSKNKTFVYWILNKSKVDEADGKISKIGDFLKSRIEDLTKRKQIKDADELARYLKTNEFKSTSITGGVINGVPRGAMFFNALVKNLKGKKKITNLLFGTTIYEHTKEANVIEKEDVESKIGAIVEKRISDGKVGGGNFEDISIVAMSDIKIGSYDIKGGTLSLDPYPYIKLPSPYGLSSLSETYPKKEVDTGIGQFIELVDGEIQAAGFKLPPKDNRVSYKVRVMITTGSIVESDNIINFKCSKEVAKEIYGLGAKITPYEYRVKVDAVYSFASLETDFDRKGNCWVIDINLRPSSLVVTVPSGKYDLVSGRKL